MNHAAGAGGCCGGAAATTTTKTGEDHSAHQAGQPAAKAETTPMEHGAGASCCAGMNHDAAPAAKAEAKPMEHGAGASCCAGMTHDAAVPAAKAADHPAGGCCDHGAKP